MRITELTREEVLKNEQRFFWIEDDDGKEHQVFMHPQCYLDTCVGNLRFACVECLRRMYRVLND